MTTYATKDTRKREDSTQIDKRWRVLGKDIMRAAVYTVPPSLSVAEALRIFLESEAPCLIVTDDGERPLGIITDSDLLPVAFNYSEPMPSLALRQVLQDEPHIRKYMKEMRKKAAIQVREIMSSPVVCADAEMTPGQVATVMAAFGHKQVPVVSGGRLVGLLTRRDVLGALPSE